jgi:hypothetical protein
MRESQSTRRVNNNTVGTLMREQSLFGLLLVIKSWRIRERPQREQQQLLLVHTQLDRLK